MAAETCAASPLALVLGVKIDPPLYRICLSVSNRERIMIIKWHYLVWRIPYGPHVVTGICTKVEYCRLLRSKEAAVLGHPRRTGHVKIILKVLSPNTL